MIRRIVASKAISFSDQRGGLSNLSLGGVGAGGGASSASGWPGMSETKASETGWLNFQ